MTTQKQNLAPQLNQFNLVRVAEVKTLKNLNCILLKNNNGFEVIYFSEIQRCAFDSPYVVIHKTDGSTSYTSQTLKSLVNILPVAQFIRVHNSHIVAIPAIRQIDNDGLLILKDKTSIPFSRRRKNELLDCFTHVIN